MVWWTSAGERVLRGAEWALFQAGLGGVWDLVEDSFSGDDLFSCGLAAFDDLQPGQKLALAAQVGQALHDETVPPPELTAHAEAAIAAVFEHVRQSVEAEIGMQPVSGPAEHAFSWRRLIAAACRESGAAGDEPLPDEACDDVSEWALLLDCLADRILWDDDYAVANHFLDADPETSRGGRHLFGIADDYYTALARDPDEEGLQAARRALRALTGRPEPREPQRLVGLADSHHALLVGPCDAGTVAAETACPLLEEVSATDPDDFDCTHAEWRDLFREAVLQAAAEGTAGPTDPAEVLSPARLAEAGEALRTGSTLELGDEHRTELRPGGWVVVDRRGCYLMDVEACVWSAVADDPDMPPRLFSTPAEALVAFLRSEALASARAERHEVALRKLGREE